ncbi:MAG: hypothetical protein HYV17_10045 [Xanthomonadales bacterium]|nr:hypothetical protein [Xanthomonadales bacterium]
MKIHGDRTTTVSLLTIAAGLVLFELTRIGPMILVSLAGFLVGIFCFVRYVVRNPGPTEDRFVLYGGLAFVALILLAMGLHSGHEIHPISIGSSSRTTTN